ncbi:MAG: chromosomal replication initiator protein DnaA [Saprospiraceae bacterium]|nr:chromosomal replication initiator protein DnaA [Saprospiraceae bacterium]
MIYDHTTVWNKCLSIVRRDISAQSYKTWFEPIKPVRLTSEALTIQVPNKFFYEWLEENFVMELKKALRMTLGDNARLEYQILVDNHRKIGKNTGSRENNDIPKKFSSDQIKNPFVIPGIKKIKIDPQLNDAYNFDSYIIGECNQLAATAGKAIAANPGGTAFNPLFIYGDVGLGKTHLANAIGAEVIKQNSKKQVIYVTLERFTNQVVQAIKNNAVNDFMNFYQMIDTLIVDDIHFLAGRSKTQEIFFNIFSQLHHNGKQIILTSDRPPKNIAGVEDRLISRFKWGLAAELTTPDYKTRRAILDVKMKKEGLELDEKIKEYICYNIKNNIRELEGVIITLVAQSTLNKKEIDLQLAKDVVNQFISQDNKEITVENIKLLVAEYFKVPVEKLHGKTRKRDIVIARQLSMYLAKNFTTSTLKDIGKNFGGRDHTTVLYSVKAVQDLMDTDLVFKDKVVELEKQVQLNLH